MDWLTLNYWESIQHPEAWPAVLSATATFFAAFVVILAAYLTYLFTRKHSKAAHNTQIDVDELKRGVDALENVWTLLSYMSFTESDYSIIRWEETQNKGVKNRRYYYHYGNLERFMFRELNDVFYKEKAGLHLSSELRSNIFNYRNLVAKLYFSHNKQNSTEDYFKNEVINSNLINALRKSYDELNALLITELQEHYRKMKS